MWDTIKEIYLSVIKTSNDRIKSPFYGVFILTWLAFNWQPISVLLFSELKIENRIGFINAIYPFQLWLPLLVASFLAYILPEVNEKITYLQSKPISRTALILAIRRKRALVADISVEKYRAKRDVTYERYMAGEEKEIQNMREEILISQERMGQINEERDALKEKVAELEDALKAAKIYSEKQINEAKSFESAILNQKKEINELQERISFLSKPQTLYTLGGLNEGLKGINTIIKPSTNSSENGLSVATLKFSPSDNKNK